MKRRKVTLEEVQQYIREHEPDVVEFFGDEFNRVGIAALVNVHNMGWCKDGATRWYHFDLGDEPVVYFKY